MQETSPELPVVVGSGLDKACSVSHSQVTMTNLMSPQDVNLMGNVFGGVILAAVDRIAYVSRFGEHRRPDIDGDRRAGGGGVRPR
jgi:hypothetical protein